MPDEVYPAVVRSVEDARRRGAAIAVDDLGVGFATLHVAALLPDAIKHDRDFVRGMHELSEIGRRAILSSWCALAARLHLRDSRRGRRAARGGHRAARHGRHVGTGLVLLEGQAGGGAARRGDAAVSIPTRLLRRALEDPCPQCAEADLLPFGAKHRCPVCGYLQGCCQPP